MKLFDRSKFSIARARGRRPDGREWAVWQHCDTGALRYRPLLPSIPTPLQPRGWVLVNEVTDNPRWSITRLKEELGIT